MLAWLRQRPLTAAGGAIILATFLAYLPSLGNGFVSLDDNYLIYLNPLVLGGLTVDNLFTAFLSYDPELYAPLTTLTYIIEHALAGLRPWMFHLDNLLLHAMTSLLVLLAVFDLARARFDEKAASFIASFCALVFALHPLSVEAVAWAAARKDVLSTFFFFLSVMMYFKYLKAGNHSTRAKLGAGRGRHYTTSVAAFALGLMAKVSIVMLPLILILTDWYRGSVRSWRTYAPYFALSTLFGIIALFGKTAQFANVPLGSKLLLASKAVWFTLLKLAVPVNLAVFYPQDTPITLASAEFLLPLLFVFFILFFLFISIQRRWCASARPSRSDGPAFGIAFFLLLLLPSFVNFFKNGFVYFSSDRYGYAAVTGIVFLAGSLAIPTALRKRNGAALLGVFLSSLGILLALLSAQQALVWKDSETLFRRGFLLYPSSVQSLHNLGGELLAQGRFAEAAAYYDRALASDPYFSQAYAQLGTIRLQEGDTRHAAENLERGISMIPESRPLRDGDMALFFLLGDMLENQGKTEEAIRILDRKSVV